MSRIRTFIGVQATAKVNSKVARLITRMEATGAGYRWVVPENLHVTLNFVGDVPDVETYELCKLLRQSLEGVERFELGLGGVGAFPSLDQPRVLWLGVDQGADVLVDVYRRLEQTLHHWGVNKDPRDYVPHMTLGRLKRGGRWTPELINMIDRLQDQAVGSWMVEEVAVFSSFRDRRGPSYTPLSRIPLE